MSLKKDLEQEGFVGDSRSETEWNKWVQTEKNNLAEVMECHDVLWEKLGTHEQQLSLIDFKKKERAKEVIALEEQVNKIESKLLDLKKDEEYISLNVTTYYEDKEWEIPALALMMNARTYRERIVHPFVMKLKSVIKKVILDYLKLRRVHEALNKYVSQLKKEVKSVNNLFERAMYDNAKLAEKAENFDCVKKIIGDEKS